MPVNVETLMKRDRHDKGKEASILQFRAFSASMQSKMAAGDYNPLYRAPLAGTVSSSGARLAPSEEDTVEPAKKKTSAAGVSRAEALAAAKDISETKRSLGRQALEAGIIGGAAAPLVTAASRAAKGFADTSGGLRARLGGAAREVGTASVGDVASQVVGGGLTGATLTGARKGLQLSKAKRKVKAYISRPGRQKGERRLKKILKGT
jgi:hypothetical protein